MTGRPCRAAPLLAGAGGAMIVALDGTVLLVAQPELRRAFGASAAQLQWTSTGYLVAEPPCWGWPGGSATGTGTCGCSASA
ncbi:hypothetical protein ACWCPO_28830 [Streptomyces albidoflavus]